MLKRRIIVKAPAKVNLYLGVSNRVVEGFHELETMYHSIDLCDTLTFELHDGAPVESERILLMCTPEVDVPLEENLVYKALCGLAKKAGRDIVSSDEQLRISVEKCIPEQGGLAGGSSDAAAALIALCALWGIDSCGDLCREAAGELGSDVPFFLYGGCAYMAGKGDKLCERLAPIEAPIVLVNDPTTGVSTAKAYQAFDTLSCLVPGADTMLAALNESNNRVSCVAEALYNNLEPAARIVSPHLSVHLDWLAEQDGVKASLLSGSGSVAFALCDDDESARRIELAAIEKGLWAYATRTCAEGVQIISDELFQR